MTLDQGLHAAVRRVYPTVAQVVMHARRGLHHHLPVDEVQLAAFDTQGRTLLALRPDELPALQEALREAHGGGLLVLQVGM